MAQRTHQDAYEDQLKIRHYSVREILHRMRPLFRSHRRRLLMAVSFISIVGAAMASIPLFSKYVIDTAIPRKDMRLAVVAMGLFLAWMGLRMTMWYFARVALLWIGQDVVYRMRRQGFRHLQRLCLRFHSEFPSGLLYDRVFERSIGQIAAFQYTIFQTLTVYITGLLFALGACAYLSLTMTVIILVGAIGYVYIARRLSPRIRQAHLLASDSHNQVAGYILDKIRGVKTIQAMAIESQVEHEFDSRVWPMHVKWITAQKETLRLGYITEALGYGVNAAVLLFGSWAVLYGTPALTVGVLVAFLQYQQQLTGIVMQLANIYGEFAGVRVGFDRLFTVLDTQSTVSERPDVQMPAEIRGEIEMRDVSFSYRDAPVLRNISVKFPPGQTVALVGRSGGGKSTLANLMLRLYDPDVGAILLDGIDIRDMPLRPYRALFGIVLQDPFLFDTTILENLRCANPEASEAEMWAALDSARAGDFVRKMPGGLDYYVGEAGDRLSGGQRQRIAIARCLLLRPKFLILDEATSALDNEAESLIQGAFDALFAGRTVFIIAHRLSTIRRADRILVVDDGRIAEDGTFGDLLKQRGIFHRLYSIATSTSTRQIKLEDAGFA